MGCMNIVIFLLQHEANPDLPTVRGETPLHLAARANQTDIIRILLRNGAQVDARARVRIAITGRKYIEKYISVYRKKNYIYLYNCIFYIYKKYYHVRRLFFYDVQEKQTPLHIASRLGNVDIVMLLLAHGAAVDSTTKDLYTALHIASKEGQEEVRALIMKRIMDHVDTTYLLDKFWSVRREYFI